MKTRSLASFAVLLALAMVAVPPGAYAQRPTDKARLELAADRTAHARGAVARVAALVEVDAGWHIQSNTPSFDYLIPTVLTLELPAGWSEPRISYPPHKMWTAKFEVEPLAVYEESVRILATLQVPADWKQDAAEIKASLRYQACDDRQCLPPRTATASLVMAIGEVGEPTHEELFAGPSSAPPGGEPATADDAPVAGDSPAVGVMQSADAPVAEDDAAPGRDSAAASSAPAASSVSTSSGATAREAGYAGFADLLGKLLFGVLGGLILNAMPCVLPVLSLKLVGILQHAGQNRRSIAMGGLATAAGIITSFLALALLAVGVRAAGGLVGWGVQFQNPAFVTFLAIVVVLFSLNLWGVFEVPLPRALSRFSGGGAHDGVLGHFVTGLFATLMATPCSAPFLGTAVGFGLSQSAGVIIAVFLAIGIGMSLPYLFMAAAPGSVARLPKPGAWMLKLKVVLGFLLAGAAIWLLYVLSAQVSPERLAAIEVGLLVLSMLVWLGGDPMGAGALRAIGRVGTIAAIAGTLFIAARATPVTIDVQRQAAGGNIDWTVFDRAQAESLARDGRLVFVDVTADWCFTCKANERLILYTKEVTAAFERHQVVPMQADWTNQNEEIAQFLADYGRYSIPFYMLYRPGAEPHLFPELLTKSDVLRVLDESAGQQARRE